MDVRGVMLQSFSGAEGAGLRHIWILCYDALLTSNFPTLKSLEILLVFIFF